MAVAHRLTAIAPEIIVGDELCFRELAPAFRAMGRNAAAPKRVLLVHHLTAWETELSEPRRVEARAAERRAIEACDWIVTTSETTKARLLAEGVRERIDVILPGADRLARTADSARLSSPRTGALNPKPAGHPLRFVFLGSVIPRKRVVALTRAFATGGASDVGQLVIVGSTTRDEAYVAEVRRVIAEHGIAERVEVTGEVDEASVARALADADVLVMASSLEGYGIAATEAIWAGLPVIAARAQGLEEALAPCPGARIFADDDAALASALARFAKDAGLRGSMLTAALVAADRMPTWARCADEFRASLRRSRA